MDAQHERTELLVRIVVYSVVRPSFQRCCGQGDDFFDAFYARLSEKAPEIGPMFAQTNMRRQNALLRRGIDNLLAHAEGVADASNELVRLGELHGRDQLDVRPDLYSLWVEALMESVRESDPQFDEMTEAAWRDVLASGIELMVSRY